MKSDSEHYSLFHHDGGEEDTSAFVIRKNPARYLRVSSMMLLSALILSTILNIYLTLNLLRKPPQQYHASYRERTDYAGLTWNTRTNFTYGGLYDSPNKTLTNEAWDAINFDGGCIALDDQYAESFDLPKAQRFPWDENKGIYFLNGYHNVHCLKSLRRGFQELHDNRPMVIPFDHLMHCFEALLDDAYCFADDTPRFVSLEHPGKSGLGQQRQCRDWKQLEAYSQKHTACWRDINPYDHIDTLLRYRYCPEGSPYNEWIHAIFGEFDTGPNASAET